MGKTEVTKDADNGFFSKVANFLSFVIDSKSTFIEGYSFPDRLKVEVKNKYPHLSDEDADRVIEELRKFFLCYLAMNRDVKLNAKGIYMPSAVVDHAWHWFLLFTERYEKFCEYGFGQFLHHHPKEESCMQDMESTINIKRNTWIAYCKMDDMDADTTNILPSIYRIDEELNIPDGLTYTPDEVRKEIISFDIQKKRVLNDGSCGGGDILPLAMVADGGSHSVHGGDGGSCSGGSCGGGSCGGG